MSILKNMKEMWYLVGGGSILEGRLELLCDEKGVCHMVNIVILNGQVHLYVVHLVFESQIVHMLEYFGPKADGNKGDWMNEDKGEDECELEVVVEREGECEHDSNNYGR